MNVKSFSIEWIFYYIPTELEVHMEVLRKPWMSWLKSLDIQLREKTFTKFLVFETLRLLFNLSHFHIPFKKKKLSLPFLKVEILYQFN